MTFVSNLIDRTRLKLNDAAKSRWEDADMVAMAQEAVERVELVLAKFDIEFAKERATLTTVADQDYLPLPADFLTDNGLYRPATSTELIKCNSDNWERIISAGELSHWIIRGTNAYFKGTPRSAEDLYLYYYTKNDTGSWTATTMSTDETPWGGKCDSIMAWYMSILASNVDGANWSADQTLMRDLENRVFETYGTLGTVADDSVGWL
ncbi:protein of unknown function [Pseudodesulfovibrio profundus]|uniref:Uncharacterized protein n=1 Tax=Pseudodesulfovibrio profundus TaxID=57320 RepID=A0A2C8FDM6_9BACT|nr:hypothetical protein [Pseudodesulfovibrio profundus]SOB60640.1 protein of unknown function [Pseudodesulfovibrio profundus]